MDSNPLITRIFLFLQTKTYESLLDDQKFFGRELRAEFCALLGIKPFTPCKILMYKRVLDAHWAVMRLFMALIASKFETPSLVDRQLLERYKKGRCAWLIKDSIVLRKGQGKPIYLCNQWKYTQADLDALTMERKREIAGKLITEEWEWSLYDRVDGPGGPHDGFDTHTFASKGGGNLGIQVSDEIDPAFMKQRQPRLPEAWEAIKSEDKRLGSLWFFKDPSAWPGETASEELKEEARAAAARVRSVVGPEPNFGAPKLDLDEVKRLVAKVNREARELRLEREREEKKKRPAPAPAAPEAPTKKGRREKAYKTRPKNKSVNYV